MPGVDSVLPRSWMFANFQGMLQNQNSILEEVSAKILPPFPTVLPLFTVSIKCCSSAECSCSTFVCLKISKLKTHTLSYTEEQICLKQTAACFGGKDGSCWSQLNTNYSVEDVSGKEVLWLLNKNDMERTESINTALTSDLVILFADG